jgi:hemophore-related protein
MKFNRMSARRNVAGIAAGILLGGVAATAMAPAASAAPDCSAAGVSGTISTVTGSARDYLAAHPGANQVVTAAYGQPRPQAEASLRGYFTANPGEYTELRGILALLGDTQRACNVTVLPPALSSAYEQFMAG